MTPPNILNITNHADFREWLAMNSATEKECWIEARRGKTPPAAEDLPLRGDTIVGNDVWIGYDAVIMAGVTIGDGAIIGTRAVVTKDVAPYSIVGGVPAREIRKRFAPEVVERLAELKWWNWPEENIRKAIPAIQAGDVETLEKFNSIVI